MDPVRSMVGTLVSSKSLNEQFMDELKGQPIKEGQMARWFRILSLSIKVSGIASELMERCLRTWI